MKFAKLEKRGINGPTYNGNPNPEDYSAIKNLQAMLGPPATDTGERVTPETAGGIPALAGCKALLAGLTSIVSCPTYKRDNEDGRTKDYDQASYGLLNDRANPYLISTKFRNHLVCDAIDYGVGLGLVTRDEVGDPYELDIIEQKCVVAEPLIEVIAGVAERTIAWALTRQGSGTVIVPAEDIISVYMPSYACSFIKTMRQTLGLYLAERKWGSLYFKQGSHQTRALKIPNWLTDDQKAQVKEQLSQWEGSANAHKMIVLQGGIDLETYPSTNEQAQFLESMVQSGVDIATGLSLPGCVVNERSGSSYNSLEQENLAILRTLNLWYVPIEDEYNTKLIRPSLRRNRYIEHERLSSLDPITINTLLSQQVASSRISLEEARQLSNKPVTMDGTFLVASGVQPLDMLLNPPEAQQPEATPAEAAPQEVAPPTDNVAATALNGAQITSLVEIAAQIANGELPAETGKAIVVASFPTLTEKQVNDIISPLENFEPTKPEPPVIAALGNPPAEAPPVDDKQTPSNDPTITRKLISGIIRRFKTRLIKATSSKSFSFAEHRSVLAEQLDGLDVNDQLEQLGNELGAVLPEQRNEVIEAWQPQINL